MRGGECAPLPSSPLSDGKARKCLYPNNWLSSSPRAELSTQGTKAHPIEARCGCGPLTPIGGGGSALRGNWGTLLGVAMASGSEEPSLRSSLGRRLLPSSSGPGTSLEPTACAGREALAKLVARAGPALGLCCGGAGGFRVCAEGWRASHRGGASWAQGCRLGGKACGSGGRGLPLTSPPKGVHITVGPLGPRTRLSLPPAASHCLDLGVQVCKKEMNGCPGWGAGGARTLARGGCTFVKALQGGEVLSTDLET